MKSRSLDDITNVITDSQPLHLLALNLHNIGLLNSHSQMGDGCRRGDCGTLLFATEEQATDGIWVKRGHFLQLYIHCEPGSSGQFQCRDHRDNHGSTQRDTDRRHECEKEMSKEEDRWMGREGRKRRQGCYQSEYICTHMKLSQSKINNNKKATPGCQCCTGKTETVQNSDAGQSCWHSEIQSRVVKPHPALLFLQNRCQCKDQSPVRQCIHST